MKTCSQLLMRYLGFSDLNRPQGKCLNDPSLTMRDLHIFRIIWPWKHLRPVLQLMYCTYTTLPPPAHTPLYFLHTMCQTGCAHTSLIISRNTHLTEHKLLSAVMGVKEAPDSRLGGPTHHLQHLLPSWERWERSLRPLFKNELFVLHQQPQTLIEVSFSTCSKIFQR